MQFYQAGAQAARFMQTRDRMIALAVHSIEIAQRNGEVSLGEDARLVGMVIFSSFQMAIRLWLMRERASVDDGLRELAAFIDIVLRGLSPSA
jgi:hypothetical protein